MENAPGGDAAAAQRRMAPGEPLQAGEQALGAKLLSQGHGRSVPAQQGVLVSWCPDVLLLVAVQAVEGMFGRPGQAQHGHSSP